MKKGADIQTRNVPDRSGRKPTYPEEGEHLETIEPDDLPNNDAKRAAARRGDDSFIVKSDLEDQDERDAAPGTRDQDSFYHK